MFSTNNFIVEGKFFVHSEMNIVTLSELDDTIFKFMYNKGYEKNGISQDKSLASTYTFYTPCEPPLILQIKKFLKLTSSQKYSQELHFLGLKKLRDDYPYSINFIYSFTKKDDSDGFMITVRSEPGIVYKMKQLRSKPQLNEYEYKDIIDTNKSFIEEIISGVGFEIIEKPKVLNEFTSITNGLKDVVSVYPSFKIPEKPVSDKCVAVMMPFKKEFDEVYTTIKEACSNVGMICHRADDFWEDSVIINDIFELIYRSSIVIVDFSGKNENVFYEAGIAHTIGKKVIPITQTFNDIPFDLSHHRHLIYLANREGLTKLRIDLEDKLSKSNKK